MTATAAIVRIGFVGLGIMGAPMAGRLAAAGHPLVVTTRTGEKAQPLLVAGARWADDAQRVAAATDVIITMLPDTGDVQEVAGQILAGANDGAYWIDMSTIEPAAWRELAARCADRGLRALDAPVSGGQTGARDGTLSIMVGADEPDFAAVRDVLSVLGTPLLVGGPGAGQVTKACNQVVTAGTIAVVAEALTLARASGVDPARVRAALLNGFAASRILEAHGARMLDGDYRPGFQARLHRKDLRIVLATALATGSPAPMTATAAQLLDAVLAAGDGELDSIVIHRDYVRLTGAQGGRPDAH